MFRIRPHQKCNAYLPDRYINEFNSQVNDPLQEIDGTHNGQAMIGWFGLRKRFRPNSRYEWSRNYLGPTSKVLLSLASLSMLAMGVKACANTNADVPFDPQQKEKMLSDWRQNETQTQRYVGQYITGRCLGNPEDRGWLNNHRKQGLFYGCPSGKFEKDERAGSDCLSGTGWDITPQRITGRSSGEINAVPVLVPDEEHKNEFRIVSGAESIRFIIPDPRGDLVPADAHTRRVLQEQRKKCPV